MASISKIVSESKMHNNTLSCNGEIVHQRESAGKISQDTAEKYIVHYNIKINTKYLCYFKQHVI